jgi:hypothetical protein
VIPVGRVGQTDTRTGTQGKVDGPVGSGQVPNRERDGCLTESAMGARRRAGLGGWPDGGGYKSGWPTFLGTFLQRPVSPARNVGAQGANE